MKSLTMTLAAGSALALATGCESMSAPQRDAAVGAGVGALAGAAIAKDDTAGALIGGAIGAAAGYYTGCKAQGGCYVGGNQVQSQRQYDNRAGRYYFRDPNTGATYWESGERRS